MAPEGGSTGGNFLTKKFAGMPGWLILAGAALLAYLIFRSKSSSTSGSSTTSGTAPQTTGDISIGPNTPNITINAPYTATQSATGTSSATSAATAAATATSAPTVQQAQPTPPVKVAKKVNTTKVTVPSVTVAPWSATNTPWNSTLSGIAAHYGISLATIEKLNPQITNPNLIYPGQKVNY